MAQSTKSVMSRADCLLLAVVAVGVGAATVAVVDEAGGGHPEGLRRHKDESGPSYQCMRLVTAPDHARALPCLMYHAQRPANIAIQCRL